MSVGVVAFFPLRGLFGSVEELKALGGDASGFTATLNSHLNLLRLLDFFQARDPSQNPPTSHPALILPILVTSPQDTAHITRPQSHTAPVTPAPVP